MRVQGFLGVLCELSGQELLTAKDAKNSAKDAKKLIHEALVRGGQWICTRLADQNKYTASRIISGSMACL